MWAVEEMTGQQGMALVQVEDLAADEEAIVLAMPRCGHLCNSFGWHTIGCCQCCIKEGCAFKDMCPTCKVRTRGQKAQAP